MQVSPSNELQHRTGPSKIEQPVSRDGILNSASTDAFARIHDPDVELVIVDRSIPGDLCQWLENLPPARMPHGRRLLEAADLRPAVVSLVDECAMPAGALREAFLDDVENLARTFMRVMASPAVDVRLETIRHDACWKFHRDFVPARLLTTYVGPGTEWVHPRDSEVALEEQTDFSGGISRFPRHSIGLFKGMWSGISGGIVHRSPPVAQTGETRLLLCLNLPSTVSPPLWRPNA